MPDNPYDVETEEGRMSDKRHHRIVIEFDEEWLEELDASAQVSRALTGDYIKSPSYQNLQVWEENADER